MAKQIKRSEIAEQDLYKEIRDSANKTISSIDRLNQSLKKTAQSIKKDLQGPITKSVQGINKLEASSKQMNEVLKRSVELDKAKAQSIQAQLKAEQELEKLEQQRLKTESARRKEAEAINKQQQRSKKLAEDEKNAYKKLTKESRDLKNESKRLGAELIKLEQSGKKNTREYKLLQRQYNNVTKQAQKTDAQLKKLDKTVGDNFRNVGNYKGALGKLTSAFGALGLSMGGAMIIRNVFGVIKDFDQAQANLASVLGVSRNEMTELTKQAKDLGATTQFTASQVSELQLELAKLGFSQQQISNMTESVLKLAGATNTELGEASAVVGSTLRAFGMSAEETGRLTDVMSKSFSSSALDMTKFSTAMANVAPVAKSAGLNIEETTAMLGALVDNGIDASTAGTGLRNVFLELAKSGMTFDEAMGKIQNATDKNAVALDLFGKRGATIGTILAEQTKHVSDLTDTLYLSAGATEQMAKTQLDTLGGSIDLLTSAWEGYILKVNDANSVGAKLKDGIKFLADNLDTILNTIVGLTKVFLQWKAVVFLSTQANKLFALSFAGIEQGATRGQKAMLLFKSGLNGIKGAFNKLGQTLKANAFGLIILALYKLYEAFNVVKTEAEQMEEIQSNLNAISDKTQANLEEERMQLDVLVDAIKDANYENGERGKLVDDLNKKYGTTLENIQDEDKFLQQLNETYKQINTQIEKRLKLEEVRQQFSLLTSEITKLNTANLKLQEGIEGAWGQNAFSEFLQGFGDYENTRGVLDDQLTENKKVLDKLTAQREEVRENLLKLMKEEAKATTKTTTTTTGDDTEGDEDKKKKKFNSELNTQYDLEKEINKTLEQKINLTNELNRIQRENQIETLNDLIEKEKELIQSQINLGQAPNMDVITDFINQKRDLLIKGIESDSEEQKRLELKKANERYQDELKRLQKEREKLLSQEEITQEAKNKINVNYKNALIEAEKGYNEELSRLKLVDKEIYEKTENEKVKITKEAQEKIQEIIDKNEEIINAQYDRSLKEFELQLLNSNKKKEEIEKEFNDKQIELLEERISKLKKAGVDTLELEIELAKLKRKENEDLNTDLINQDKKRVEEQIAMLQMLTNISNELADKRIAKIQEEIDASQRRFDLYSELAKQGNITAKESLAEEQRLIDEANRKKEQAEKRKQQVQLASSVLQTYIKNSNDPEVSNPLSKTVTDTILLTEFIKSLPTFLEGTENTGNNGKGIDGKGGFLSVLHPNERVVPAEDNKLIGDISNSELAKLAYKYQSGMVTDMNNKNLVVNGYDTQLLAEKLDKLEQTIKNKPETNIELEQIIAGTMAITRTTKQGNTKIYNRYRV